MANVTITPKSNEVYKIKPKNSETQYYLKDDAAREALANVPVSLSDNYTSTDEVLSLSSPAAGDSFETAISKLHTGLVADERIIATGLNDLDTRIKNTNSVIEENELIITTALNTLNANKTNVGDSYTKAESDAKYLTEQQDISGKANVGDSYTKAESDAKYLTEHQDITGKANVGDSYTKQESDTKYATNNEVDENEMVIAAALNDLHDSLNDIHVSAGVSSVNGATGDITGIATETYVNTQVGQKYSKPSGGIPITDLASSIQTSLQKADSALQSAPVTSVNGQTGAITLNTLPTVTAADNGKILMVVNGAWALVSPSTLYSGSGVPNNENGNNGDIYTQTDE